MWGIAFGIAICILSAACIWALLIKKLHYKRRKVFTPFNIVFGGVAGSSLVMFFPIYVNMFFKEGLTAWELILLSVHNTISLFVVGSEFSIIIDNIGNLQSGLREGYIALAVILFVAAPLLTFGFVLSFFRNISAYKDYFLSYFSEVYVFSELNEESLALAESLKKNNKKRHIVFTDIYETVDEYMCGLVAQAEELNSIMFRRDVGAINYDFHSRKKKIVFFIIGKDDDENVKQTLSLVERYNNNDNFEIYAFTTSANSEMLFSKTVNGKIKLRRINEVQSLISRHLYDEGIKIFETAVQEKDEKIISVAVIGMGKYGTEMTKALSWFGQMTHYRLELNIFDIDKSAETRFCFECPELMDEKHNNDFKTEGEAHYSIKIHSGIDVETMEFLHLAEQLKHITYVFIALGDDDKNIQTAAKLRSWFLKSGHGPKIDAVVRNSDKKNALRGITNYSGQEYDINFIGDIVTSYSEEVVFESDIEIEALKRHLCWGKEEEFWKYEYNYRSSIASAIHKKMKILCGIPGVEKRPEERTEKEKVNLRVLEHCRWNAYMRSEGFSYAEKRNNLAKTHHCLVPFAELPLEEQRKDDD